MADDDQPKSLLDRFDRVQLADVVRVCRESRSLSEAGRTLFAASRARRTSKNDADRVRKYLARFALDFETLKPGKPSSSSLHWLFDLYRQSQEWRDLSLATRKHFNRTSKVGNLDT